MKDRAILLVEDNPVDVELTLRALTKTHVSTPVVVARGGEEALDYLFARGAYAPPARADHPRVIFLDLKLPKVDGLEVLRAIRADPRTRLLPVVILTSSVEERDLVRSYALGANSYIRKPVDFNEFVESVKQLGQYWLVLNQPVPV